MSRTKKHQILGKWKNGIIQNVPYNIQQYWNRINFSKGEFLFLRKKKQKEILDRDLNEQLNNLP